MLLQAEERIAIELTRLSTTDSSLTSESHSLIDSCAGAETTQSSPITGLNGHRIMRDYSQSVNSVAAWRANGGGGKMAKMCSSMTSHATQKQK